ncbi:MAG: ABC transporter permease [Clostridia bacterium]|nr:ABC transporter permease [Clostridia bacterium]
MKQFKRILVFELGNYLKNKVFVGVTVFLAVVIAAVMFFPRIKAAVSSNEPRQSADKPIMLVAAENMSDADMQNAFASVFGEYEVKYTDEGIDSIKNQITGGAAECAFVLHGNGAYTYYVNNLSMYDTNTETAEALLSGIRQVVEMTRAGLTAEDAQSILSIRVGGETVNLGKDQMQNFFYTYIMIFALYMVILLYGQMVATNVATEKSSRAMELLITSARPASMMFGKVIASCIAGLTQLAVVFGSALVFYNLNSKYWGDNPIIRSIFDMPTDLFAYMLLFFVLGFLIYAFMFGAVGSTASKLEDINTSVMPITLLFIGGFLVVMLSMTSGNVDTALMKVCSYIPFTSPMAMFTRLAMSTVKWYETAVSVAILICSVVVIGIAAAKIYRVGVLMYGTTPRIGNVIKAVFGSKK